MTKHLRNLGAYSKAIAATLGSASATITALMGLGEVIPADVAGALTSAAAALTAASVYLVRNHDLVDSAGDSLADLLED